MDLVIDTLSACGCRRKYDVVVRGPRLSAMPSGKRPWLSCTRTQKMVPDERDETKTFAEKDVQ